MNIAQIFEDRAKNEKVSTAYVHENKEISLQEMDQAASRMASGLEKLVVRPGDRVAVMVPDSIELVSSYLGIFKAWAVPITFSLGPKETGHIFNNEEPGIIIASSEIKQQLALIIDRRNIKVVSEADY